MQNMPRTTIGGAMLGRRSVRRYTSRLVTHAQIEQIVEAARWAPSPHNCQPWRFVTMIRGDTAHPRTIAMVDAMADRWREHLRHDGEDEAHINARLEQSRQRLMGAPALVLVCLFLANTAHYPDQERQQAEVTMAIQSLGCAVQNMLLMAYSMGLDCGWVCAPLFCPDVVRTTLGLPDAFVPHALITVGYAAEDVQSRERLPLEELLLWYE